MVRTLDAFWAYVEDMNDGNCKKCKFCEHTYGSGTSVSRVKYHLSGLRRAGVKICEMVPNTVQEAARAAIDGPPEKKHKTIASSSNNKADNITIPAYLPEQNREAENGMADRSPTTLQPTGPECRWMIDDALMNDERNMIRESEQTVVGDGSREGLQHATGDEARGQQNNEVNSGMTDCVPETLEWWQRHIEEIVLPDEGMSPEDLLENMTRDPEETVVGNGFCESLQDTTGDEARGQQNNEVDSGMTDSLLRALRGLQEILLADEDMSPEDLLENLTGEPEETVVGNGFHESLQHTTGDEARGDVFPTPKLVGRVFKEKKKVILSWLENNEVSLIGIYGMGGVGKTTLMKHIYNQLRNTPDKYRYVYWITVSQDFSVYKLQNLIAKRIGVDLSNEDDEIHRAAVLSRELAGRQNYVLILDDLWNHFEPEEMGIPIRRDGCKLIITTRSLDVCRRMGCERNVIKVQPLSKEAAWNLFKMELGNYDIKLEPLAKSVADECDGLPLGIRTMARSMRGVYDLCEWRNTLEELKESKARQSDMEPEVFRILKFSYLHLNDSALQQCFLYCALFPEDFPIKREDLIEFLIVERIIEGKKSRQAEFDKGHQMLNQLENACLLESGEGKRVGRYYNRCIVRMHDLVRDMALQQLRENSNVMVEAGEQLEELPDEEKWSQYLVRVSLMKNYIKTIPSSHSPRCPNLSTLLLSGNTGIKFIDDSFFEQMQRLHVLDLSDTAIEGLPNSISNLVTLTALLLGNCCHLTYVPSLGKLKALKKLDLYKTALKEVPQGLGLLSSLKYLDLNRTLISEFPTGILPKLCHLQVLILNTSPKRPFRVKVEELACLRKLETLGFDFDDLLTFKKYLKALDHHKNEKLLPSICKFVIGPVGTSNHFMHLFLKDWYRKFFLYGQDIKRCGDALVLPKGIQELVMEQCSGMESLCDFYPSQHEIELKSLAIMLCPSIKCLVSFSQMSKSMLGTIEALCLSYLGELRSLYGKGATPTRLLPGSGIFVYLKELKITYCQRLEALFPPGLLPNLQNLEEIQIGHCSSLGQIITKEESNIGSSNSSSNDLAIEFSLPKLQSLHFFALPALMSFGCRKLVCNSLQYFEITSCKRLKRLPFSCSPQTVKDIKVWPKIWWESVEWDLKNDFRVTSTYSTHGEDSFVT